MTQDFMTSMDTLLAFLQKENKMVKGVGARALQENLEEKNRLMSIYNYHLSLVGKNPPLHKGEKALLREKLILLDEALEENNQKLKGVFQAYDQVAKTLKETFMGKSHVPLKGYSALGGKMTEKTAPSFSLSFNRCL
jgi:hypothetical protein